MPKEKRLTIQVDDQTEKLVSKILAKQNLTIDQAISLLLQEIIHNERLPFATRIPNEVTRKAIEQADNGETETYLSVEAFLKADREDD